MGEACSMTLNGPQRGIEPNVSLKYFPLRWNDRRLLEYSPLSTVLALRKDSAFPFDSNWPALVKANIDAKDPEASEFSKAFIRWCLIAFGPLLGESPTTVPGPSAEDFVKQSIYWELFIDVLYGLCQNSEEQEVNALRLINNKRIELGLLNFHVLRATVFSGEECVPELVPATHMDVEVSDTQPRISMSPKERILGSAEEIEAASKAFMEEVPKDGVPKDGVDSGPYGRYGRRPRKAAPGRDRLADIAKKEKEFADETRARRVQQKRFNNNEASRGRKTKVKKPRSEKDTVASAEVNEVEATLSSRNTSKINSSQIGVDTEVIVVNNRKTSLSPSCVSFKLKPAPSIKQKCGVRNTKKRKPRPISAQSMPPAKAPLSKKRKLPNSGEGQESEKERVPLSVAKTSGDRSTSNRRSKMTGNSANSQMRRTDNTSNLGNGPSARLARRVSPLRKGMVDNITHDASRTRMAKSIESWHAPSLRSANDPSITSIRMPLTSVANPSSSSSDETLVDETMNGSSGNTNGRSKYGNASDSIDTFELDAVEDRVRLEKMEMSYEMSRPCLWPKPALPRGRRPLIWAGSRQALCETTTWFRCYHGGVYFNDGKAHGYLLGGYSSQRDVFRHDGRFIISHGGGKSLEGFEGQRDQDVSVRSLLNSYRNRCPLVLVVDNKYAPFPFDLGEKMYVVLGLYWIADVWAEKDVSETGGNLVTRIKYKFAFQYCEGQGSPWWLDRISDMSNNGFNGTRTASNMNTKLKQTYDAASSDKGPSNTHGQNIFSPLPNGSVIGHATSTDSVMIIVCPCCGKSSPRIYKQGWMCLHPDCASFFCINSEETFTLDYDEQFLKLRPHPDLGQIVLTIQSPLGIPEISADSIYSTKGWWCPECGQLCPRERWECWACSRCNISFTDAVLLPIRSHKEFWAQELDLKGYTAYRIQQGSGITVSTRKWSVPGSSHSGLHYVFELPDNRGRIHLVSGNTLVNRRADDLFRQYQEDAKDKPFLRRYPLRSHHARGRMLANYFSHNAGAPYKYAVSTNSTVPFDQAPESVNGALQFIKDRVSLVLGYATDFNEILTAAYMIEQKMSYHTDDEKGLGPVVASLSLGSVAFMHFRKHKTSADFHPERQLTLILRHGDVLAMEGAAIQKLYDHTVVPTNFRIAATARYIHPNP